MEKESAEKIKIKNLQKNKARVRETLFYLNIYKKEMTTFKHKVKSEI